MRIKKQKICFSVFNKYNNKCVSIATACFIKNIYHGKFVATSSIDSVKKKMDKDYSGQFHSCNK
jgi:hypothetical protein